HCDDRRLRAPCTRLTLFPASTISTLCVGCAAPSAASAVATRLVEPRGPSTEKLSSTTSLFSDARNDSAARSAAFLALRGSVYSSLGGLGPSTAPPPTQ